MNVIVIVQVDVAMLLIVFVAVVAAVDDVIIEVMQAVVGRRG